MAIDMQLIREAMMRRAAGGGVPVQAQMTPPTGTTPMGGPNTPSAQPMPVPMPGAPSSTNLTPRSSGQPNIPSAAGAAQAAGKPKPQFDDETKMAGKVLMKKLLDVL